MNRKTNKRGASAKPKQYEYSWSNKWLTAEATNIDDMIGALQEAADELRKMKASGVTLEQDGGVEDDYATLVTDDPSVAEEFGFRAEGYESDEEDDELEGNEQ